MRAFIILALGFTLVACSGPEPADLLLVGGRVYTLAWPNPEPDGQPAASAPHDADGWRPDAEAVAIRDGEIVFAGSRADAEALRGPETIVRDLDGATVLPGLIDAHVHLAELGASLERVDLTGVETEDEAIARVIARAEATPAGEWIVGWGWDEGAWANRYPDMRRLSEAVPDHPVALRGLHSFAVWGNRLAFARAGLTADTPDPTGGEIRRDAKGQPTGVLINNAGQLLMDAMPAPSDAQLAARVSSALRALAEAGYTVVHEAGADAHLLRVLDQLAAADALPVRVYAMLAARDTALIDEWRVRGPRTDPGPLVVRSIKAFYDGAMGSRGAFFFHDYSDRPGHRGTGGAGYGFDRDRMAAMMRAGFQVVIHAIGDRANREALDFVETVYAEDAATRATRPRVEHAQVVHPDDLPRFASLGVIASMQPAHAVEDMPWAEARIGPDRLHGGYAWRSLRRAGARLVFNSDLPATDYDIFYGLHSAVTRQNRSGAPEGGWRAGEAMTIEEAVRGWTTWAAHAGFEERRAGVIAAGRPADLTVVDIDPFTVGETEPGRLLRGRVVLTLLGGRVVER